MAYGATGFAPIDQWASGLTAGLYGSSGVKRQTGATVVSGPVYSPTGALVPYANYSGTTIGYGTFATSGTRITPTGAYSTRSIENAAKTYYQDQPGEEIRSFAPGARQVWQDIAAGFLPDLSRNASLGVEPGTAPGMPIWVPLGALAVLGLLLYSRKR